MAGAVQVHQDPARSLPYQEARIWCAIETGGGSRT